MDNVRSRWIADINDENACMFMALRPVGSAPDVGVAAIHSEGRIHPSAEQRLVAY